jgi:hypothetical protein
MRAGLGLVGLLAGGCAGSEACVDFADEVLVVVSRTDDGEDTRIEVELRRALAGEDSIPVKLCVDNALAFDGVDLVGVKRPNGAVVYEATAASGADAKPVVHELRLENDDGVSEFAAEVDAPGFTISAPEADAKASRAADLAIAWAPAHATATITLRVADEIDGETCLAAPFEREMTDIGEATVEAGAFVLAADKSATAACEAFVTLSRRATVALETTRGGVTLHPDSRVEATNSRVQPFRSVP